MPMKKKWFSWKYKGQNSRDEGKITSTAACIWSENRIIHTWLSIFQPKRVKNNRITDKKRRFRYRVIHKKTGKGIGRHMYTHPNSPILPFIKDYLRQNYKGKYTTNLITKIVDSSHRKEKTHQKGIQFTDCTVDQLICIQCSKRNTRSKLFLSDKTQQYHCSLR